MTKHLKGQVLLQLGSPGQQSPLSTGLRKGFLESVCLSWVLKGEEAIAPGSGTENTSKGQKHQAQRPF